MVSKVQVEVLQVQVQCVGIAVYIKYTPLSMGYLGHSPVAWTEAIWPVASPTIGQIRQQVPLAGAKRAK